MVGFIELLARSRFYSNPETPFFAKALVEPPLDGFPLPDAPRYQVSPTCDGVVFISRFENLLAFHHGQMSVIPVKMLQAEVCLGVVREIFGIKTASAHIILVEYILHDRVRWTMVVSRIILIEFDGDDDTSADVGASPFSAAGVELQADVEFFSLHIGSCHDTFINADLIGWRCSESALTTAHQPPTSCA